MSPSERQDLDGTALVGGRAGPQLQVHLREKRLKERVMVGGCRDVKGGCAAGTGAPLRNHTLLSLC